MKKLLLLLVIISAAVYGQPQIPQLKQWATDFTNTFNAGELSTLNGRLSSYEDTTSNQVVFVMISTLGDYPLEYFTMETAEKNKIGTAENDNGVLFAVIKDDRKMRIEVGYGLEGAIPDALANSIIRNEVGPYFKRGQFYEGTVSGINAIMAAAAGEYTAVRKKRDDDDDGTPPIITILMIIFFIVMSFLRGGRGRRGSGMIFFPGGFGGGGRSGGFGGGGFGGGGFSGGGGGFGGGGSSGGW